MNAPKYRSPTRRTMLAGMLSVPAGLLLPRAAIAGPGARHRLLHTFAYGSRNEVPIEASDGHLYGVTLPAGASGLMYRMVNARHHQNVHRFSQRGETRSPIGRPVEKDGAFYGVTHGDGNYFGTIYRLDADRTFTVLDRFGRDTSIYPWNLMMTRDGRFFGTADGSIFTFTDGRIENFYQVPANGNFYPLIEASDGHLYAVSPVGGAFDKGVVLRLAPDGTASEIYAFSSQDVPQGALLQGLDGALYGVTALGGGHGRGTVYRLTLDGQHLTVLHSFSGADGGGPCGGLVQDAAGNFYGVTAYGGVGQIDDSGTAFRIGADGTFESLHSWEGLLDGRHPTGLCLGSDGRLYGTTESGGEFDGGTLFALTLRN